MKCSKCGKPRQIDDFFVRARRYRTCKHCRAHDRFVIQRQRNAARGPEIPEVDAYPRDPKLSIDEQIAAWDKIGKQNIHRNWDRQIGIMEADACMKISR